MNLVLDAFERVLYPTGAAAERRRRASTGLVTGAGRPIVVGGQAPLQPPPPPLSHPSSSSHHHHQRVAANRRRSGTPNGGTGTANAGSFMAICQSNSLTGISRNNHDQRQQREHYSNEPTTAAVAMSQHGSSAARSRSTALGGRRKKSMNVQRKQSVASLLFSALSSPTTSGESSRIRRRQSRVNGALPSRQWSVPERAVSIERGTTAHSGGEEEEGDGCGGQQQEEEEPPFCLIQKTHSMALSSSPGARTPPARQLSADEPISPQSCAASAMGSPLPIPCCPSSSPSSSSSSVLLGFFPPPVAGSFRPLTGRRPSDSACLADWIRLRAEASILSQALLLRCVDPEPAFPFLQFANMAEKEQTIRLAEELAQAGRAQFGCYEEIFALERAKGASAGFRGSHGTIGHQEEAESQQEMHSGSVSPSTADGQWMLGKGGGGQQHRGFILVCFRLLDEENDGSPGSGGMAAGSAELESSWLTWTGAGQIYKYSPRAWALCRLALLRRVHSSPPSSFSTCPASAPSPPPFAYVLLCQFDAILHPSNALAALDMCERLRARNCGLVALYQVRQSIVSPSGPCHSSAQSLSGGVPSSLSPHWSPHQVRRQQLARMGRSQDERGRQGGGGALLRMIRARESSLGWDQLAAVGTSNGQQHWRGEPGIGTSL